MTGHFIAGLSDLPPAGGPMVMKPVLAVVFSVVGVLMAIMSVVAVFIAPISGVLLRRAMAQLSMRHEMPVGERDAVIDRARKLRELACGGLTLAVLCLVSSALVLLLRMLAGLR